MKPTISALGRMAGLLLGGTLAVVANAQQQAQQPNKLEFDSTPAYQERNVTPPAAAAAHASDALKTRPGQTSSGKEPPPDRPNGLGFDAGSGSMGKK